MGNLFCCGFAKKDRSSESPKPEEYEMKRSAGSVSCWNTPFVDSYTQSSSPSLTGSEEVIHEVIFTKVSAEAVRKCRLLANNNALQPSNVAVANWLRAQGRKATNQLGGRRGRLPDVVDEHASAKCILGMSSSWSFNSITLDYITGGRSLPTLCVHLFEHYDLFKHFRLDPVCVMRLFMMVDAGYDRSNPYHNVVHAVDVAQAMHCFLQQNKIRRHLEPLEIMSCIVSAATHDLCHPGVTQQFLTATSHHLAKFYENQSVLENHHCRCAISVLLESGFANELGALWPAMKDQVHSLIMATDITKQEGYLMNFKRLRRNGPLDIRLPSHRHAVLEMAMKCADISNPCRPWGVSLKWSVVVCKEFFAQADREQSLGVSVGAAVGSVPRIQIGFVRGVVVPLMSEWHDYLRNELSSEMAEHMYANIRRWGDIAELDAAAAGGLEAVDSSSTSSSDEDICSALRRYSEPIAIRRPHRRTFESISLDIVPTSERHPPPTEARHVQETADDESQEETSSSNFDAPYDNVDTLSSYEEYFENFNVNWTLLNGDKFKRRVDDTERD